MLNVFCIQFAIYSMIIKYQLRTNKINPCCCEKDAKAMHNNVIIEHQK